MRSSSAASRAVFAFVVILAASHDARADLTTMGRIGLVGGAWMSWFREGGGGVSAQTASQIRPALNIPMGLQVGPVIAEYTLSYYPWIRSGSASERVGDAVYYSLLGGNIGIDIPFVPIEAYVGAEDGHYVFSSGASNEFSGIVIKGGVNVFIGHKARVLIKAEYRRAFFLSDRGGWLPDGISATSDLIFLGLGFQFGFGHEAAEASKK